MNPDILLKVGLDASDVTKDITKLFDYFDKLDKKLGFFDKRLIETNKFLLEAFDVSTINNFNTTLSFSNKELAKFNQVIKASTYSNLPFDKLKSKYDEMLKNLKQLGSTALKEQKKLDSLKDQITKATVEYGKSSKEVKQLEKAYNSQLEVLNDSIISYKNYVREMVALGAATGESAKFLTKWVSSISDAQRYVAQLSSRNEILKKTLDFNAPITLAVSDLKKLSRYLQEGAISEEQFVKSMQGLSFKTSTDNFNLLAEAVSILEVNFKRGAISASTYKKELDRLLKPMSVSAVKDVTSLTNAFNVLSKSLDMGNRVLTKYRVASMALFKALVSKGDISAAGKVLQEYFSRVGVSVSVVSKYVEVLEKNIGKLQGAPKKAVADLVKVFEELAVSLESANVSTGKQAKELSNLKNRIHNVTTKLKAMETEGKRTAGTINKSSLAVQAYGKILDSFSAKAKTLFQFYFLRHILFSLYDLFNTATDMTLELEQKMTNVAALMKLTGDETKKITQTVLELGLLTGADFLDIAGAFEQAARAGLDLNDAIAVVTNSTLVAKATMSDMDTAINTSIILMKTFGLTNETLAQSLDTVTTIVNKSRLDLEGFNQALKYVGAISGQANISVKEMASAVGVLADSGLRAQQSGVYLRSVISNLLDPSAKFKQVIESLGLSLIDVNLKYKSFSQVLGTLNQAFSKLGSKQEMVMKAFQADQRRTAQGLSTLIGLYDQFKEKLETPVFNTTAQLVSQQLNTMETAFKRALLSFQEMFRGLIVDNQELVKTLLLLIDVVKSVISGVTSLITPFNLFAVTVVYVGRQIYSLSKAFIALKAAEDLASTGSLVTVFVKIALAVGSLIAGLKASKKQFSDFNKSVAQAAAISDKLIENYKKLGELINNNSTSFKVMAESVKSVLNIDFNKVLADSDSYSKALERLNTIIKNRIKLEEEKKEKLVGSMSAEGEEINKLTARYIALLNAFNSSKTLETINIEQGVDSSVIEEFYNKILNYSELLWATLGRDSTFIEDELKGIIKSASELGRSDILDLIREKIKKLKDSGNELAASGLSKTFYDLGLSIEPTKAKLEKFYKILNNSKVNSENTFDVLKESLRLSGLAAVDTIKKFKDLDEAIYYVAKNGGSSFNKFLLDSIDKLKVKISKAADDINKMNISPEEKEQKIREVTNSYLKQIEVYTALYEKTKIMTENDVKSANTRKEASQALIGINKELLGSMDLLEKKYDNYINSVKRGILIASSLKTQYITNVLKAETSALKEQVLNYIEQAQVITDLNTKTLSAESKKAILEVSIRNIIGQQAKVYEQIAQLTSRIYSERQNIVNIEGQILQAKLSIADVNKGIYGQQYTELQQVSALEEYLSEAADQAKRLMDAGQYQKAAQIYGQIAGQAKSMLGSVSETSNYYHTLRNIASEYYEEQINALEKAKKDSLIKLENEKASLELQKENAKALEKLVSSLKQLDKNASKLSLEEFKKSIEQAFNIFDNKLNTSLSSFISELNSLASSSIIETVRSGFESWSNQFTVLIKQAKELKSILSSMPTSTVSTNSVDTPSYHSGGFVSSSSDELLAVLQKGEYVIPRDVVKTYGVDYFEQLRQQKYALPSSSKTTTKNLGTLVINVGGNDFPVQGEMSVLEQLMEELKKQQKMRGY